VRPSPPAHPAAVSSPLMVCHQGLRCCGALLHLSLRWTMHFDLRQAGSLSPSQPRTSSSSASTSCCAARACSSVTRCRSCSRPSCAWSCARRASARSSASLACTCVCGARGGGGKGGCVPLLLLLVRSDAAQRPDPARCPEGHTLLQVVGLMEGGRGLQGACLLPAPPCPLPPAAPQHGSPCSTLRPTLPAHLIQLRVQRSTLLALRALHPRPQPLPLPACRLLLLGQPLLLLHLRTPGLLQHLHARRGGCACHRHSV